jgi:hypothetical protein
MPQEIISARVQLCHLWGKFLKRGREKAGKCKKKRKREGKKYIYTVYGK